MNMLKVTVSYAQRIKKTVYTLCDKTDSTGIIQVTSKIEAKEILADFPELFFYCASKPNGTFFYFGKGK